MSVTEGGEVAGRGDWGRPWIRGDGPSERPAAAETGSDWEDERPLGTREICVVNAADATHRETPELIVTETAPSPLPAREAADTLNSAKPGILTSLKQIHENNLH